MPLDDSIDMVPGDEAPAGAEGAGENLCPECEGTGQTEDGGHCDVCQGTGRVIEAIGGG
jgi:DnaJ-class molecular chaperone